VSRDPVLNLLGPTWPKLFVSYIPAAAGDRWDIVITEILAGYYEPDELVLPPLSGSCSPLCSRL
jgi:hypothetical protein